MRVSHPGEARPTRHSVLALTADARDRTQDLQNRQANLLWRGKVQPGNQTETMLSDNWVCIQVEVQLKVGDFLSAVALRFYTMIKIFLV